MKNEYRILEEKLDSINSSYVKSLGTCRHSKYQFILERILNDEYYWFVRFVLLASLDNTSDISCLCEKIVNLSVKYITTGTEEEIIDYECNKYKISDFVNKYDDYINYLDSFDYSIKKGR